MITQKEVVVVYVEHQLLADQRDKLRMRMSTEFPGMQIAIVDGGVKVEMLKVEPLSMSVARDNLYRDMRAIRIAMDEGRKAADECFSGAKP